MIFRSRVGEAHPSGFTASGPRYLVLVRHARRRFSATFERDHRMDGWDAGRSPSDASDTGWRKTLNIAIALAERLEAEGVRVSHILHSGHEVARQTGAFADPPVGCGPVRERRGAQPAAHGPTMKSIRVRVMS